MSPDHGVRMTVHGTSTLPTPEDEGVNIAPGFITNIAIDKVGILLTKNRFIFASKLYHLNELEKKTN